jgi:prophage regulatory protein
MTRIAERLLDKWAIEDRTSLDITTIYRKIKAGTFPAPVRIGIRRVAWRESDIVKWQQDLVQGVAPLNLAALHTSRTRTRSPHRRRQRGSRRES